MQDYLPKTVTLFRDYRLRRQWYSPSLHRYKEQWYISWLYSYRLLQEYDSRLYIITDNDTIQDFTATENSRYISRLYIYIGQWISSRLHITTDFDTFQDFTLQRTMIQFKTLHCKRQWHSSQFTFTDENGTVQDYTFTEVSNTVQDFILPRTLIQFKTLHLQRTVILG